MARKKHSFIHKPVYPGGKEALQRFLKTALRYPPAALQNKTEGSVRVEYSLNQKGKVVKATAVDGPKDGCREEAERLVKLLRFQVPKDYKLNVRYHQHLNIHFKLPKTKKTTTNKQQITYKIVAAKGDTNDKSEAPKQEGGYGYTISW